MKSNLAVLVMMEIKKNDIQLFTNGIHPSMTNLELRDLFQQFVVNSMMRIRLLHVTQKDKSSSWMIWLHRVHWSRNCKIGSDKKKDGIGCIVK